jgi:hypothetical protein
MPPTDREPVRRPPLLAGRGVLGTLAWLVTSIIAVATVVAAVRRGNGWGTALAAVALATGYTFIPWIRAASERAEARHRRRAEGTLTVNEWGVTRVAGKIREAIAWDDLAWVKIYTTSDGPGAEDFFFALGGADGKGCLVANSLAISSDLLATLQKRLPGIDNQEIARAAGSVTEAWFTVWTRPKEKPGGPSPS